MTRKSMIEIIAYEALSWDGLDTNGVPKEEIAEDMLRVVEKYGMRPPLNVENYHFMDKSSKQFVDHANWYFAWDEENEKE
jgi:hypothetical protein